MEALLMFAGLFIYFGLLFGFGYACTIVFIKITKFFFWFMSLPIKGSWLGLMFFIKILKVCCFIGPEYNDIRKEINK